MLTRHQKDAKTLPKGRRFTRFRRTSHPLGYLGAELRRGGGSQHVPTGQLVPDHTKDAPPTADPKLTQPQSVLQPAVGRLDPQPHGVPLLEDIGLLFFSPRSQTLLPIAVIQGVATVVAIFDRAVWPERTSHAGSRWHFHLRLAGLLVACAGQGFVPRGAGVNHARPLVECEVIDREGFGVALRGTARDRPNHLHAEAGGG